MAIQIDRPVLMFTTPEVCVSVCECVRERGMTDWMSVFSLREGKACCLLLYNVLIVSSSSRSADAPRGRSSQVVPLIVPPTETA